MTDGRVPARVDRAALERILQRAAELQAAEHDIGEGLTPDDVLALGKDVGIPAHLLRQAMLEDQSRAGMPQPSGLADEVLGPGEVSAVRVVRGDQAGAERALLDWMQKNELLVVQRHQPGRISWERMAGMQAAMRRGLATLDARRARFVLDRADLVRATVAPLEDGYVHVSLTASLRQARGALIGGSAAMGSVGLAGSAVLIALNALWFIAAAPVAGGALTAWIIARRFRPMVDRTRLGLERALDHVEGAAIKPAHELPARGSGLLELVTGELRKALAPGRPR